MTGRLYLRPSPRAFFLITDDHCLIFRQPTADESKAARSVVVAEFLSRDQVDVNGLVPVGSAEGVLGVCSVPSGRSTIPEVFLLLLTSSRKLSPLLPGSEFCPAKVVDVEFYSLSSNFWDPPHFSGRAGIEFDDDYDEFEYAAYATHGTAAGASSQLSQAQANGISDPCKGMREYLRSGGFFYAEGAKWDISSRIGAAAHSLGEREQKSSCDAALEDFDERFVWNAHFLEPILSFRRRLTDASRNDLDSLGLIIPLIQGYVGNKVLPSPSSRPGLGDDWTKTSGSLGLISRLSWKRAGARFRTRGIDDDGNVANFVETESILTTGDTCVSYVQLRGSVPVFWQQPTAGLGTLQQRVEITRPPAATQHAFDVHFETLLRHYGAVHVVNLLGLKDAEATLSSSYEDHYHALKASLARAQDPSEPPEDINYTAYDFHSAVRVGGHEAVRSGLGHIDSVNASLEEFMYTAIDLSTGSVLARQQGVFRVNCLDCLDRTNFVQEVISSIALSRFLSEHGSPLAQSAALWSAQRDLWADNGDLLSKTYAGTGAINTSATRSGKKTFAGLLSDATKSVSRAYINNFKDQGKQESIDMLLGLMAGQRPVVLFDPIGDSVHAALLARSDEYSTKRNLTVFSGTWNVNGKAPNESVDPWLFPKDTLPADVYLIAFQEIVELTAQQIVQTDPAKKRVWEALIMKSFEKTCGRDTYILMRSEQLVGTALMVVVKSSLLPAIRNIEYAYKKTGLQGLSGNKGGVGVRFDLCDSSLCLMTCHLAAGQDNYADRNADYRTINSGLTFLRGKTIDNHDIVIWAADFNYRIDLSNDEVREAVRVGDLDKLLSADQLLMARDDGQVLPGYLEGPPRFNPTYKYDNGSDNYDTSEKHRIPAWTDRILFKGIQLQQTVYDCAPLRTSDHRPVYALFNAYVVEVDHARKAEIAGELSQMANEKLANGHFDDLVSSVAENGGVRGLVKELTSVSVEPSPRQSPVPRTRPPPISRESKPRARQLSAVASAGATTLSQTLNSAYSRLGKPPPLPARNGLIGSAPAAAASYEPRQRRAAPLPPSMGARSGSGSPDGNGTLTPVTTGDFVIVPSPKSARPTPKRQGPDILALSLSNPSSTSSAPQLPPRLPARPVKSRTLDMDGPPPETLSAPVLIPDNTSPKRAAPPLPSSTKPKPGIKQTLFTPRSELRSAESLQSAEPADFSSSATLSKSPKKVAPAVGPKPHVRSSALLEGKPHLEDKAALSNEAEVPVATKRPPELAPKPGKLKSATVALATSPTSGPPQAPPKPLGLKGNQLHSSA